MAPAHSHDHYEETIYGLDGVITFTVDRVPIDIGPGQALCIPRGAIHRYDNNGSAEVKGFCAVTPAHLGPEFFREAAAIYAAASAGPADRVKLMDLMRRQQRGHSGGLRTASRNATQTHFQGNIAL